MGIVCPSVSLCVQRIFFLPHPREYRQCPHPVLHIPPNPPSLPAELDRRRNNAVVYIPLNRFLSHVQIACEVGSDQEIVGRTVGSSRRAVCAIHRGVSGVGSSGQQRGESTDDSHRVHSAMQHTLRMSRFVRSNKSWPSTIHRDCGQGLQPVASCEPCAVG